MEKLLATRFDIRLENSTQEHIEQKLLKYYGVSQAYHCKTCGQVSNLKSDTYHICKDKGDYERILYNTGTSDENYIYKYPLSEKVEKISKLSHALSLVESILKKNRIAVNKKNVEYFLRPYYL